MSRPGPLRSGSRRAEPAAGGGGDSVLDVRDLSIDFRNSAGTWRTVVDRVTFSVAPGETVGLVGESGSGKTVTSLALLGLVPDVGGRISSGTVRIAGRDIGSLSARELGQLRGGAAAMIFQQPTRSLNPAFRVGDQIAETVRHHLGLNRRDAWTRAVEVLDRVRIPDAARRARDYPHQFSGGQAQRIMIAMAISCSPRVLIADEPTTALDATVQARIIDLLKEVQAETGVAIVLISHDLRVVAELSRRVIVMYAGQVVEEGDVEEVARAPRHPYTSGLIRLIPRGEGERPIPITGSLPSFDDLPRGCRFHPRCPEAVDGTCTDTPIELTPRGDEGRLSRCALVPETGPAGGGR